MKIFKPNKPNRVYCILTYSYIFLLSRAFSNILCEIFLWLVNCKLLNSKVKGDTIISQNINNDYFYGEFNISSILFSGSLLNWSTTNTPLITLEIFKGTGFGKEKDPIDINSLVSLVLLIQNWEKVC